MIKTHHKTDSFKQTGLGFFFDLAKVTYTKNKTSLIKAIEVWLDS